MVEKKHPLRTALFDRGDTAQRGRNRNAGRHPAGRHGGLFHRRATVGPHEVIAAAVNLRKAGLEPVVHIAARRQASAKDLQELLARLNGEAQVHRLLVIGGDADTAGPFADALASFRKAVCARPASKRSASPPTPKPRPHSAGRLEASLDEKIASATAHGLAVTS